MDIGRSFSYVTEDENWVTKILLGGLISLIPFVGQFYLAGYALEALKNIIAGREVPLPEVTEDFGGKLIRGLLLSVITFIYFLPITLISTCSGVASSVFTNMAQNSDTANAALTTWGACLGCISLVYGILVALILPFVWSKYAETDQFGDAFKLSEIFELLKNNIGEAIIVVLVSALAAIIAGIVGFVACIVGLIFTLFYAELVTVFLYGSLYRTARAATT
jgi:uncharacterized RDD family membrane protein YckC